MLQAYGVTDKGRVRPTNEDCFAVDEGLRLCVVAEVRVPVQLQFWPRK